MKKYLKAKDFKSKRVGSVLEENFELNIYIYFYHIHILQSTNEKGRKTELSHLRNVKYHLCDLKYLGRIFHGCSIPGKQDR